MPARNNRRRRRTRSPALTGPRGGEERCSLARQVLSAARPCAASRATRRQPGAAAHRASTDGGARLWIGKDRYVSHTSLHRNSAASRSRPATNMPRARSLGVRLGPALAHLGHRLVSSVTHAAPAIIVGAYVIFARRSAGMIFFWDFVSASDAYCAGMCACSSRALAAVRSSRATASTLFKSVGRTASCRAFTLSD